MLSGWVLKCSKMHTISYIKISIQTKATENDVFCLFKIKKKKIQSNAEFTKSKCFLSLFLVIFLGLMWLFYVNCVRTIMAGREEIFLQLKLINCIMRIGALFLFLCIFASKKMFFFCS